MRDMREERRAEENEGQVDAGRQESSEEEGEEKGLFAYKLDTKHILSSGALRLGFLTHQERIRSRAILLLLTRPGLLCDLDALRTSDGETDRYICDLDGGYDGKDVLKRADRILHESAKLAAEESEEQYRLEVSAGLGYGS